MTATTLHRDPPPSDGLIPRLHRADPLLTWLGLAMLAVIVPAAIAAVIDPRQLNGADVWLKPIKFMASTGLFALTAAFFTATLPPERRRTRALTIARWTIVGTTLFEVGYITLMAGLGQRSHFNESSTLTTVLFALMGLAAVVLTATTLPLAAAVARHARLAPPVRRAAVIGLVLTFALGAGAGMVIAANGGYAIGATGAGLPQGLPLFGWSTVGGDLRVAHFLGIHAQQLLPLAAAALVAWLPARAGIGVWIFSALYVAAALAVFGQALAGQPLLAL